MFSCQRDFSDHKQRTAQVMFKYHQKFRSNDEKIKYNGTVISLKPQLQLHTKVTFGKRMEKNYPKQHLNHMTELLSLMDFEIGASYAVSGIHLLNKLIFFDFHFIIRVYMGLTAIS